MTKQARGRLLFVAPLPEPITGQSLACQVLLDEVTKYFDVTVIDTSRPREAGRFQYSRKILMNILRIYDKSRHADIIYYNNSESLVGNVRDLLVYIGLWRRLDAVVLHMHGGAGMQRLMHEYMGFLRWINRPFLQRMAAIVVLGPRMTGVFSDAVPRDAIRIIPNFAADDLFSSPESISHKFSRPATINILFLSNLLPGKGYLELVEAYRRLTKSEQTKVLLHFAGGFPNRTSRRDFMERISALPGITYHGTVVGSQKRSLLERAHVFCLPTYYPFEGQPISILEAYAAGCVVVTTDHSGIGDVFSHSVNGFIVEKKSSESIVLALRSVIDRFDVLGEVALNNNSTAQRQYTRTLFCERMISLLREVTDRSLAAS